jgi:tetratricopeptide (TPR) repeat protein
MHYAGLRYAIEVLEQAIKEDPSNANRRWFHQMASMYKGKGDLEGARRTYRANMEFDPRWNSQWEDLCYNKLWNSSRHRILKLCRNEGILKEGRDCLKIYLIRVISRSFIDN